MKLYTREQVEKSIEKGTDDTLVQHHIDHVKKGWESGRDDYDLQFSYGVICDNEKKSVDEVELDPLIEPEAD